MKKKNLLRNPWFHMAVWAAFGLIMVLDVVITKSNSYAEMTLFGQVATVIFAVDFLGFAFYMVILRMIFKVKW